MGVDFSFYKLKKGLKKAYPIYGYDCKDEENWDDYDEVAYFPNGSFILNLMDIKNSKASERYSKSENEIYNMYGQIPVCKDDIQKAIDSLELLERKVKSMPYEKDIDYGKIINLNYLQPDSIEGVDYDVVEDIQIGSDSTVYVATGTQNARNIIKEVYSIYGLSNSKFAYPWDIDSKMEFKKRWKYAEHELKLFKDIKRVFEEEPNAEMFIIYG